MRGPELSLAGRTDLHFTYEASANETEQKSSTAELTNHRERIPLKFVYYNLNATDYLISRNETWYRTLRLKSVVSVSRQSSNQKMKSENTAGKLGGGAKHNGRSKGPWSINGIIDLKVATEIGNFFAAAGPPFTLDNEKKSIDPFQWSTSRINYLPHDGHSDTWNYRPIQANYVWD